MVVYCLLKIRTGAFSKRWVKNKQKESVLHAVRGLDDKGLGLDDKGFGDCAYVVFYIFGICFVDFAVSF